VHFHLVPEIFLRAHNAVSADSTDLLNPIQLWTPAEQSNCNELQITHTELVFPRLSACGATIGTTHADFCQQTCMGRSNCTGCQLNWDRVLAVDASNNAGRSRRPPALYGANGY
jgi:hypothetical protein